MHHEESRDHTHTHTHTHTCTHTHTNTHTHIPYTHPRHISRSMSKIVRGFVGEERSIECMHT